MGHSGAGKTTLLNILGGMDTATSGHVRLDGREITGLGGRALTEYRRNDVGFVFQFYNPRRTRRRGKMWSWQRKSAAGAFRRRKC